MLSLTDTPIVRDGKSLILAHDHGLEHGPTAFSDVPERLDPETVFEMASHDAVTGFAVQKGLAETYYPSYTDDVNLLANLNGTRSLWMGEPYSPQTCSVEYALELGADIAKVKYPRSGEAMTDAVDAAGDVHVVLSGGSKTDDNEFLSLVETAMNAGASGLAVGRNVWQREDPVEILDALGSIMFDDATAEQVFTG